MNEWSVRQDFLDLQMLVNFCLRKAYKDTKNDMQSVSFYALLNYLLSIMGVFVLFLVYVSPKMYYILRGLVEKTPITSFFFNNTLMLAILVMLLSILLIFGMYFLAVSLSVKYKRRSSLIYFVQSGFVVPVTLIVIDTLMFYLLGTPQKLSQVIEGGFFLLITINILYLIIDVSLYMYNPFIPGIFLAILYGTTLHKAFRRFPSHDSITFSITKRASKITCNWDSTHVESVNSRIATKRDGLNSQGQAVSYILATIALASLIGIDKITSVVNTVVSTVMEAYTSMVPAADGGNDALSTNPSILTVVLFLFLLYIICSYFAHSYNTLRVLEIMEAACEEKKSLLISHNVSSTRMGSNCHGNDLTIKDQKLLSKLFSRLPSH